MGSYKGNVGHLMQHWTLCKVLRVASEHAAGLSYIDAYAMSPWATKCTSPDSKFKSVKKCLPGSGSDYEGAWHSLVQQPHRDGYPNSSAFVGQAWKHKYSLILCEKDPQTADEIEEWREAICKLPNCTGAELFRGDWRTRFERGLPSPRQAALPDDSLTLVAFDPNMCSRHSPRTQPAENLYPQDLQLVASALGGVKGGVLIQLSTYTANGNNPQGAVISSVNSVLYGCGFALAALVRANGHMMSLVYARDVKWAADLTRLAKQFEEWL